LALDTTERKTIQIQNDWRAKVAAEVPPGHSVSTIEALMPSIYDTNAKRDIYLYPVGLDAVDYIILPYVVEEGKERYFGAISFLGPSFEKQINEILFERIQKQGFFVENIHCPNSSIGLAIFQRKISGPASLEILTP